MPRPSRNTWRIRTVSFVSLLAFALFVAPTALAGTYRSFDSTIELSPDASFVVHETITGAFKTERHGIYRAIPIRYETGPLGLSQTVDIDVLDVTLDRRDVPYDAYRDGSFLMIKIGDSDTTFSGPFSYEIDYRVRRAMIYGDEADELYWNVTGNDWDEGMPSVSATVLVPGVTADQLRATCYTGTYGSTAQDCQAATDDGRVWVSATDFLTVSVLFPKGVVREPTAFERAARWAMDNWDAFTLLVPVLLLPLLLRRWFLRGRDAKGRGTIVAEYGPPDGLRPTVLGVLADGMLSKRDFSAGIIDLAVRGYVQIIEKPRANRLKRRVYAVRRLRTDEGELLPWEKEILNGIVGGLSGEVNLDDRREQMALAFKIVHRLVYEDMETRGYYARNPNTVRWWYFGAAIGVAVLGHIGGMMELGATGRGFLFVAGYATAALLVAFGFVMPRRTEAGTLAWEKAAGFKLYLSTAEKYRVQWQEQEGIFERFLPYAMAFGVADKWAKALADAADATQPTWYVGNFDQFRAVAFVEGLSAFSGFVGTVSAPSNGGGSGGGGFSGGGFGGGGGGSW